MPLLASFIGAIATGLVAVLSRMMAFDLALKYAAYIAWIAVFSAFVTAVFVCTQGLVSAFSGMFSASGNTIVHGFGVGLGMFIPSNAGTVMGCVASVWIASQIYKIQKQGMHHYSK
jgi:hypothetical protein